MQVVATITDAFVKEMLAIRRNIYAGVSKEDYDHLRKIIWINRCFLLLGFGTAWIIPNPVSMFAIAMALTGMWTIVAHHVLHGGYDSISAMPKRYHSSVFAKGWRRYIDWPDWMYPPAWQYEHNTLHHFFTNESTDPDQMSYRLAKNPLVSGKHQPDWLKKIKILIKISFWKCNYYAFNTMKAYAEKRLYRQDNDFTQYTTKTYCYCIIPYIVFHFILLPLLFFPLGLRACLFVFINRLGAEMITNWHTFFIIVTNHTGADLPLQTRHFTSKKEFYFNQSTSSCNFNTGGFWHDYFHGYLNYQIEHHLFPNLPASQYPKLQPLIKSLCVNYHIPYVQESVFKRSQKLFAIMLQKETMQYVNEIQHSQKGNG